MEDHLSLAEAAERMGISERTARRWIKSGKLRAYKPGRDYWIPETALTELVEESKVSPKGSAPSPEPSLFNGLEDERREAIYQHALRDFIRRVSDRVAAEADGKGYAPEWIKEIDEIPRDITAAIFDNGLIGNRDTYPTEAEWHQSLEIIEALDELKQAIERAWRAQIRTSEKLKRRRDADELAKQRERRETDKDSKEVREIEAMRNEGRDSA